MIRSLTTAVSGLRNHQLKMDVIGNNIANVNTTAYKSAQVRFEDLMSQLMQGGIAPSMRGGINPMQIGLGMTTSSISNNFTNGPLQNTDRESDLAIVGEGFFVVTDGRQIYYTRDGSFTRDAAGELVNAGGYKLLGWAGDREAIQDLKDLKPVHIPLGEQVVAAATSYISFAGNLDAAAVEDDEHRYDTYLFDSLGRAYTLELTFTRHAADSRWDYALEVTPPDGVTISGLTGTTGYVVYGEDGQFSADDSDIDNLQFSVTGAADFDVTLDMAATMQLAGASNVMERYQDGFPTGELVSFSIGSSGVITGSYTNGMTAELGAIALAYFVNPGGLVKEGGNLYQGSPNSGEARLGLPGTDGRGLIRSSTLEMSNTDLAFEFTEMITTSRAFQANTRVITTSDEILMEVINLKR